MSALKLLYYMIHYISFIPVAQNIKGHNASIITTIGIATSINQYIMHYYFVNLLQ